MNYRSLRVQWTQLAVLSGVHFLVDMFSNMLPAILPVLREQFTITLSTAGVILAALALASNGVQVMTGHLRPDKTRPLFLHVGMVLAAGICLIVLIPRSPAGIVLLFVLGVVSGSGIAIAHPEGLRAIHTLERIPPAMSTAVFMTAGFLGFASGGMISAVLVSAYGLKGLYPLIFCPIAGILAIVVARVRLSTEDAGPQANNGRQPPRPDALPFWKVLGIGLPAAVSTTVVLQLIPTYLADLGFGLRFGGFSAALFGWGGAAGPFLWAAVAHRKGNLPCLVWAFFLSFPFMVLYLLFATHSAAAWLLVGVGFSSMSAYILTITLARDAHGSTLGQRMAMIVGGTWGIAMVVFLALAAAADRVGTGPILQLTPAGYLLSGILSYHVLRRHPQSARPRRAIPVLDPPGQERAPA
jgi:MFS transporter, FSR family, fosmidomycin resistance protein